MLASLYIYSRRSQCTLLQDSDIHAYRMRTRRRTGRLCRQSYSELDMLPSLYIFVRRSQCTLLQDSGIHSYRTRTRRRTGRLCRQSYSELDMLPSLYIFVRRSQCTLLQDSGIHSYRTRTRRRTGRLCRQPYSEPDMLPSLYIYVRRSQCTLLQDSGIHAYRTRTRRPPTVNNPLLTAHLLRKLDHELIKNFNTLGLLLLKSCIDDTNLNATPHEYKGSHSRPKPLSLRKVHFPIKRCNNARQVSPAPSLDYIQETYGSTTTAVSRVLEHTVYHNVTLRPLVSNVREHMTLYSIFLIITPSQASAYHCTARPCTDKDRLYRCTSGHHTTLILDSTLVRLIASNGNTQVSALYLTLAVFQTIRVSASTAQRLGTRVAALSPDCCRSLRDFDGVPIADTETEKTKDESSMFESDDQHEGNPNIRIIYHIA
ncbi:hypothetical protein J6590_093181 [Homalodisca vitripennis]|nr:hypothetical protein J6590_093181 [Homalodisca vitripennis]